MASTDDRLRALEDYLAQPPPPPTTDTFAGGTIVHTPFGSYSLPPISKSEAALIGAGILGLGVLVYLFVSWRRGNIGIE